MASVAPTPESAFRPIPPALAAEAVNVVRGDAVAGNATSAGSTDMVPREAADRAAIVASEADAGFEADPIPAFVLPLPVAVAVAVPVRNFRVRNLLAMRSGTILETQWGHGDDLPLASGETTLAWTEFEVIDTQLAVRVTRLA